MNDNPLLVPVDFRLGPVAITQTVVTTWLLVAVLGAGAAFATRRLREVPGPFQAALEGLVLAMRGAVEAALPKRGERAFPLVATLWIYLVVANLAGIVPGLHAPTGDISATAALALVVFFFVHWAGVRTVGWKRYLRHYLEPTPFLLPFEILSEITRTLTLAIRLFGNMMSLELTALMVLLLAGFLIPIPILMLHIVEALVQAYIFGMLALVYVAGAIMSQPDREEPIP